MLRHYHIPVRITRKQHSKRRKPSRADHSNLINIKTRQVESTAKPLSLPFTKSVRFCSWNAGSVKNKTTGIKEFILDSDIDVLALVETWLFEDNMKENENTVYLNQMVPKGYLVNLCSRPGTRTGGGICIIYKETFNLSVKDSSNRNKRYKQFEFLDCLIRLTSDPRSIIRLVVVYRPPPSRANGLKVKLFWPEWFKFLNSFNDQCHEITIVGDLNFHLDDPTNSYAKKFNASLKSYSFKQLIKQPTYTSGHTLDILITKSESFAIDSSVDVFDLGVSDNDGNFIQNYHYGLSWSFAYAKPKPKIRTVTCRNLKRINGEALRNDLANYCLEENILKSGDVDRMVEVLSISLQQLIDKHAPLQTRQAIDRSNSPWYTEELQSMKQRKRSLERAWKKSCLEVDRLAYRKFCALYSRHLHCTCISQTKDNLAKCGKDRAKLSKTCKSLIGDRSPSTISLPNCKSDAETAHTFSKFFSEKIKKIRHGLDEEAQSFPPAGVSPQTASTPGAKFSSFTPTDPTQIERIINESNNKSCILDSLPTPVLKTISHELSLPLSIIINQSLSSGIVPTEFKTAIVIPSLKKPHLDPHQELNYRPISNLKFISKVLEKVVYKQLDKYLTENNFMSDNQSAYKAFHSTETSLLKVTNDILIALDQGKSTLLVTLDMSAAFDTVDHQMLLKRYNSDFGICGVALDWLTSYLTGRKQMIKVGDFCTAPTPVEFGFPQGSVLGGLKYNAYTSPLDPLIRQHNVDDQCYADDSNLYISFNLRDTTDTARLTENLTDCLNHVKQWMVQNRLQLNASKTEAILFKPPTRGLLSSHAVTLHFDKYKVDFFSHITSLGVILDENLKLERQVNAITKTAHFHLRKIKRVRNRITKDIAETLVNTLVTSRLDYCNALLCHLPKKTICKLQKVQNASAKMILQANKRSHVTPLLKHLHWLPVSYRCQFKVLILTFKILHGTAPVYLKDLVSLYRPNRSLRSVNQFFLKRPGMPKKKCGERAFSNLAPVLWNGLPTAIRKAESLNEFKSKLKSHFFIEHYGSGNEHI